LMTVTTLSGRQVTGQVDFDSHVSGIVLLAADLVNLLTPGESAGRAYSVPVGPDRVARLEEVFRRGGSRRPHLTEEEADNVTTAAGRLRAVFEAVADNDLDQAAETLNALMARWGAQPRLDRHDNEPWHLHFHPADADYIQGWAAGLATGLAFVVGSELADRLGVCSAPTCDRVYADTSRNGTRRFCSTACQNRVKAAAFRARKAAEA
jgi:predicted RNA-binding Zn ribbon-like protein